jgi:GTP-binding protein YchF
MKLGIIGLPQSGKSTVFEALTKSTSDMTHKGENRISTIRVPDSRIDTLSEMYRPQKTIYAQVEYFLPGTGGANKPQAKEQSIWAATRECDALIHVIRNFSGAGFEKIAPYEDFRNIEQELILADLVVVEKRLERIELDHKRGKKTDPREHPLLIECRKNLENEIPLRRVAELASARELRGFTLLSAKPMLVLFNNDEENNGMPEGKRLTDRENCLVIRGKLEQELAQMSIEEAAEFLNEFNISESAMNRVIRESYNILGLISFFTVGKDEVRAWTVKIGTPAVDAAEVIHSDIKKGFIRAEALSYDDLLEAGTYADARKKGTVRLEGKTYEVKDGDIINFRFNV